MKMLERTDGAAGGVLRRVARSSAWYAAGFAFASGASFAVSIVVGRALGPADFGRFSYHIWVLRLLASVLTLGVPAALTRHVAQSLGGGDAQAARGYATIAARAALVLAPVAAATSAMVSLWRDGSIGLALAVGAGAAVTLIGVFFDGLLGGFRAFRALASVAFWSGLAAITFVLAGAASGADWRTFVALQVASTVVGVGILAVASARRLPPASARRIDPGMRRRLARVAGTMAVIGLLTEFVLGRPELFFLDRWWPEADVGLYSAALRLSTLAVILPGIAARVLVSEFSWTAGTGAHAEFRESFTQVCRYAALVGVGLGVVTASVSDHLIRVLFGPSFGAAGGAAALLLLGGMAAGITAPVGAAILSGERHAVVARLTAVAAVVNVGLDVVLIPRFGVMGAAIATMAALVVSSALVTGWAWRRGGLRFPLGVALRLLGAGLVGGCVARLSAGSTPGAPAVLSALGLGALAYLVVARLARAFDPREVSALWSRGRR